MIDYDDAWPNTEQPDDDPQAGCWQPRRGPDGYIDCDGRPI
ncbi:hypothetical protein [Kitasatospora kifunensis]|uniref:Uncharacterized protein n=1 Tax=Kitasatospora kifunensis TaxID=58351 RepID=A0A7W7QYK6_KITKI|nr:hypothetical protein [Kitasatospora kifunensis]MBB4922195.1 hypothetical protein [Kitasatospora kifunensis]